MTKEELEKEAEVFVSEKADKGNFDVEKFGKAYFSESSMKQALVKFAEPREKRIAELEKELALSEHDREHNDYELAEVYKKVSALTERLEEATEIIEFMKDLFFDCWQERGLEAIKFEQKVNNFLKGGEV